MAMIMFADTSAMLKRYVDEPGSDVFQQLMEGASRISVAPTYLLEAHAAFERRNREKSLTPDQVRWLKGKVEEDCLSYHVVEFSRHLCETAKFLIATYAMVTLDSLQLASGMMTKSDVFVTSDKQLYRYAKLEMKNVKLI